jgi:hypothetical protein
LEYLATVRPYLNGAYGPVERAAREFVKLYYGSEEVTAEQINALKEHLAAAKAALKNVKRQKDEDLLSESQSDAVGSR